MNRYKRLYIYILLLASFFCFSQEAPEDTTKVSPEFELYKSASKLIDTGRYKDALVQLKKAVKINRFYADAYSKMAYAKTKLNDTKGAEKDLTSALKIDPNHYESLKLFGIINFNAKKYTEAKLYFDSAAVQNVDDAEFLYLRGKLMYIGKNYKGALDIAAQALELKPKYTEVFILKAESRFAMKEYKHAIKELDEAIKLMPDDKKDYSAYKLRAKAKFEVQDYKGAVNDWNVYIDAIPQEEEALISRGAAKIQSRDNSGAIVDLDAAIKINPKNPVSYNYRGVAKGENKQFVEALKDFDYSIKLKFNYPSVYVNRAAVKFASKDKRGACEDLNKADSLGDQIAYKLIEQYCK